MVDAVAEIALAFRAIAELQPGAARVRAPADRTLVVIGLFAVGAAVVFRPVGVRLLRLPAGLGAAAILVGEARVRLNEVTLAHPSSGEARREIAHVPAQKQQEIQQRDHRRDAQHCHQKPRGKGGVEQIIALRQLQHDQHQIDQRHNSHFDRDDEKHQHALLRNQASRGEEEREVDVIRHHNRVHAKNDVNQQRRDRCQQDAREIIAVEAERSPCVFEQTPKPIIKIKEQHEKQQAELAQGVAHGVDEHKADQTPDLPVQDFLCVEAQHAEHLVLQPEQGQQIDHQIGRGDPEHQVRDALVPVAQEKAVDIAF